MKKIILLSIVVALIAEACAFKASRSVTEATIPTEETVSKDAATIEAGHNIFTTKCTVCHHEKPIHKWTYEKLRPILGSMVKKAKLNHDEVAEVSAYVHANCKK